MIRLHPHPWLDSGVWFQWLPKQSLTLKALIPGQCYGIWLLVKKKKSSMSDLQGHWDHLALLKITSGEPRFGESKRGLTLAGALRWTGECYRAGHWPWTMENFFFSPRKTWRPDFILQPTLPLLFWTTPVTTASPSEYTIFSKKYKNHQFWAKVFSSHCFAEDEAWATSVTKHH